ncbi:hypothetical protein Tco_0000249 [Tanacetum coccineum]
MTDLKNGASSFRNVGPDESKAVEESESDVEDIYDETTYFMASGCANDASLYEDDNYDIYDNYDIQGCFVTRCIFVFEQERLEKEAEIRRVREQLLQENKERDPIA